MEMNLNLGFVLQASILPLDLKRAEGCEEARSKPISRDSVPRFDSLTGVGAHEVCAHRHLQPTDTGCFQGEVPTNRDGPFYDLRGTPHEVVV
jgi:hypothetical protein